MNFDRLVNAVDKVTYYFPKRASKVQIDPRQILDLLNMYKQNEFL